MQSTDVGIFLHRSPYSSSSLIVWFYTEKNGLQKFIFKGGKKKSHNLYPLSISELTYYGKSSSDLLNLISAESIFSSTIPTSPVKGTIAFFMAEVVKKSVHLGDVDSQLFKFIQKKIEELNLADNLVFLPLDFLVGLCSYLGFSPLIDDENPRWFDLDSGTIKTTQGTGARHYVGKAVELILNRFNNSTNTELTTSKEIREEALNILLSYYRIHVPNFGELDSYEIVKEVLHQ